MITLTIFTLYTDGSPASESVHELTVTDAFLTIRNELALHSNGTCDCPPGLLPFGVSWEGSNPFEDFRLTRLVAAIMGSPCRSADEYMMEEAGGSIDRVSVGMDLLYPPDNR